MIYDQFLCSLMPFNDNYPLESETADNWVEWKLKNEKWIGIETDEK